VVPFNVVIAEHARDPLLAQAIIDSELARVLAWALQGLVRLERRGCFDPLMPAAMTAKLHEVKAETNSILAWMDDCEVRTLTDCATPKERVFEPYRAWCSAGAMQEMSVVQFWKRLKSHVPDLAETRTRVAGQQRRMCNICLGGTAQA
jgi:putative DNA primase/helicase